MCLAYFRANEKKNYMCIIFTHWLRLSSALDKKTFSTLLKSTFLLQSSCQKGDVVGNVYIGTRNGYGGSCFFLSS